MSVICLPSTTERDLLGALPDGVRALVWVGTGEPPDGVDAVEFFVARYSTGPAMAAAVERMPRLKVIQLLSAGVEPWLPLVPDGVVLCSGRGVHGSSTAELALGGMLSLLRELPRFWEQQSAHRWAHTDTDSLAGKRVLVIGAGDIGRRIAAAVTVFDAQPTLVARTARDGVHSLEELPNLLPDHDIVVVAVPHTEQTHHLVGTGFLAAMPDGAMLVNIARGLIVDTDALVAELEAGRLRAFLDVSDPEPLPVDHPLWRAPNLLLTPHVGGGTQGWQQRAYRLVGEQIARFHNGEPLQNVVTDGY